MPVTHPLRTAAGFYELAARLCKAGRPFATATVLETSSSTPVKAGAKALIDSRGQIHGTVGGGAVEAEALRRARQVIRSGTPEMFDFNLHGPGVHEASPICGGSMRLLVAPGTSAGGRAYARAAAALGKRERGWWLSALQTGDTLKVKSRFLTEKDLASVAPHLASNGSPEQLPRAQLFQLPSTTAGQILFLEPLVPDPVLVIAGGGHVSQALAAQASLVGFDVIVFEDRPEFANPALFPPETRTCQGAVPELLRNFPVNQDTFIVLVTRNHQQDTGALRACIHTDAAYIGMIGSRRKVPLLRREFLKSGWATREQFQRVYAPIGIDLGAATVPEIATSIVAQLIAVRRKGVATRMPLK